MNAGGVLLVVLGVWVVAQVLGGDALGRLNLTGSTSSSSTSTAPSSATSPATPTPASTSSSPKVVSA